MQQPSVSESRDIDAPAARIFSILCDPEMHPQVDGTGMVRSAVDNSIITKVGDVFYMTMVHWDLGSYVMENHVFEFEQDRLVSWEPVLHSIERSEFQSNVGTPAQQQWGWQLEPLSGDRTRVTESFDCSRCPQELRNYISEGEFWRMAMLTSLFNLDRLSTESKIDKT